MTGDLIKMKWVGGSEPMRGKYREKATRTSRAPRQAEETGLEQGLPTALRRNQPARTSLLDFWLPKLWDSKFLLPKATWLGVLANE